MNRFIYLTAIVLFIIGFSSCEKEESRQYEKQGDKNTAFFRHSKSGDKFLNFIISSLSQADDSISFTGDFVKTYGLPYWSSGVSYNSEDLNSLIVPVVDKNNQDLVALYYLKYEGELIETYILINDRDDITYTATKYLIHYFEKNLGLSISNKAVEFYVNSIEKADKSKLKISVASDLVCTHWIQIVSFGGYSSEKAMSDCNMVTSINFNNYSSGGGWANSGGGNYPPNGSYGGGNSGNNNTKPIPDPVPEILPTQEFTNSKAGCIYDKLKNLSGGFAKAIQKFDGEFPVSHLKFSLGIPSNPNANASTSPPSNYIIEMKFNPNKLNRPNLSIARTMIHEMIHAEMFRKILSIIDNGGDLNGMTRSEWTNKLSNGDYPGIYDYYSRFGANKFQHEQMASHYRETMISIMKEFDNSQSDATYEALAWVGLHMTTAWNNLSESKKTEIRNLWKSFDAKGGESCD